MCENCFNDADERIDNEAVRAVALLVAQVYVNHPAGGWLHIVTDDWNIEDGNIQYCLECLEASTDDPRDVALQTRCAHAMLALTEDERASALGLRWRYWASPHLTDAQFTEAERAVYWDAAP